MPSDNPDPKCGRCPHTRSEHEREKLPVGCRKCGCQWFSETNETGYRLVRVPERPSESQIRLPPQGRRLPVVLLDQWGDENG